MPDERRRVPKVDVEEALAYHGEIEGIRGDMAHEIDGIVVKVRRPADQEGLGVRARDTRRALALKSRPPQATTEAEDIVIQVGRTGRITPVAILEPVQVGGAQVGGATLHNQSEIERKDIRISETVLVERAADVIPQLIEVIEQERTGSEEPYRIPERCPLCGALIALSSN